MGGAERNHRHQEPSGQDGQSHLRRWVVPGLALIPIGIVLVSLTLGVIRQQTRPDIDQAMREVGAEYRERIDSGEIDVADLILQAQLATVASWDDEPGGTHDRVADSLPAPEGFRISLSGPDRDRFTVLYTEARGGIDRRCFRVILHPDAVPEVDRSSCSIAWQ
jgi:hypothetical protein